MLLNIFISGLTLGSLYAILAFGFSLIFGVTRAFNLAHGELIILGGYISYWLWKIYHLDILISIPLVIGVLLLLGLTLQYLFIRVREPYELNTIVITFGLALILKNVMRLLWTGDYRLLIIKSLSKSLHLGNISIPISRIFISIIALIVIGTTSFLIKKTYFGKLLRATIQNRIAAMQAGINTHRTNLFAILIGVGLIGLSGPLYATVHYIYPDAGLEVTLIAIFITIFAGIGRIGTVLIGGLLLGIAESMTIIFFGSQWREMMGALLLISILIVRPQGLAAGRVH
jgi:branched-chain amino acid transport system permease protein